MSGKWTRQHEVERQKILEMLAGMKPFDDSSDAAQKARKRLDFLPWCRTYLPHLFLCEFEPFHEDMVLAASEPDLPTFVCAFRGAGKTQLLARARTIWRILNQRTPFAIFGSAAQLLAAQNMDAIRIELQSNPRIRADYGEQRIDGAEEEWTVEFASQTAPDGTKRYRATRLQAFGTGMQVRGKLFGADRPHDFLGDDLEDLQIARSTRREDHLWHWLWREVEPALEPSGYLFTVLCNMFGPGCLLLRAEKGAETRDSKGGEVMRVFRQPIIEGGVNVWPARYSDLALERKRLRGDLAGWLREYMLEPADPAAPFQPQWIDAHRYREEDLPVEHLDTVTFLDPAISETGCPRALVCVSADRRTGVRYIREAWIETGSPHAMLEKLYEFDERFHPRLHGIEENGGYALLRPLLQEVALRRGWLPVAYKSQSVNKELRIERLGPGFEAGRWRFPATPSVGVQKLEEQFLAYPEGYRDGPDACASADEMLPNVWGPSSGETHFLSVKGRSEEVAALL